MSYEAEHPAPAELLAVSLGTLDPGDRDWIEEHLSQCPQCAQTVLDFEAFPDLTSVDEGNADVTARLEDQKRRLIERSREQRVESQERTPSRAGAPVERLRKEAPSRSRDLPWIASPVVAWAVAAVFFVATVGLGVWRGGSGLREGGEITSAVEGLVVLQRSPGEQPEKIVLGGHETRVELKVQEYARKYSNYRVLLRDRRGNEVSSTPVSQFYEGDRFVVTVPDRIVSAGLYQFEVHAEKGDEEDTLVGSLAVEFVEPEPGAPLE